MDNQQDPTVYTGNSGQYYVAAARWEGVLGENEHMSRSGWVPFCPPKTITALLVGYNKMLKNQ